jgi:hypothetical protein
MREKIGSSSRNEQPALYKPTHIFAAAAGNQRMTKRIVVMLIGDVPAPATSFAMLCQILQSAKPPTMIISVRRASSSAYCLLPATLTLPGVHVHQRL